MKKLRLTQRRRVVEHLRTYKTIQPMEALKEYGIYRLGAVIYDLRADGWDIETENVVSFNIFKEKTHYAKYILKNEPVEKNIKDELKWEEK